MWIRKSIEAMQKEIGKLNEKVNRLEEKQRALGYRVDLGLSKDDIDTIFKTAAEVGETEPGERPLTQDETIAEIKRLIQGLSTNHRVGVELIDIRWLEMVGGDNRIDRIIVQTKQ